MNLLLPFFWNCFGEEGTIQVKYKWFNVKFRKVKPLQNILCGKNEVCIETSHKINRLYLEALNLLIQHIEDRF